MMIRHHEGAIVMCNRIIDQWKDPRSFMLAVSIRHAQLEQMERMRELLRQRNEDGAATVPYTW